MRKRKMKAVLFTSKLKNFKASCNSFCTEIQHLNGKLPYTSIL